MARKTIIAAAFILLLCLVAEPVWDGRELIAVVVYKKGAIAVIERITKGETCLISTASSSPAIRTCAPAFGTWTDLRQH